MNFDNDPRAEFCEKIFCILAQKHDVTRENLFFISTFSEDLDADELDQAPIVEAFEKEFGIQIPGDAEGKIKNIGECAIFVGTLAGIPEIEEYVRNIMKEEPRIREEMRRKSQEEWERKYQQAGILKKIWMRLVRASF